MFGKAAWAKKIITLKTLLLQLLALFLLRFAYSFFFVDTCVSYLLPHNKVPHTWRLKEKASPAFAHESTVWQGGRGVSALRGLGWGSPGGAGGSRWGHSCV